MQLVNYCILNTTELMGFKPKISGLLGIPRTPNELSNPIQSYYAKYCCCFEEYAGNGVRGTVNIPNQNKQEQQKYCM